MFGFPYSLFSPSYNAIRFGGYLHKNNTSYLLLGLYHALLNWISIVLMQITSQNEVYYGNGEEREFLLYKSYVSEQ